jgi:atypical dual specificity phosphatase
MEKLSTVVDKSVQFINAAHAHGSGTRVLVHCNQGVSRSSAVVIAYLMKCKRLRLMDAYNYVAAIRPSIQPNFGFMEQLNQLDAQLFLTSNANNTVDDT